jgi:hypothetical protein
MLSLKKGTKNIRRDIGLAADLVQTEIRIGQLAEAKAEYPARGICTAIQFTSTPTSDK